jgi:hypothetical protein
MANAFKNSINSSIGTTGVKVYETHSYDTNGNTFNGYSQGRTTVNSNEKLPFGTYFYIIEILNESTGDTNKLSGYIFIN